MSLVAKQTRRVFTVSLLALLVPLMGQVGPCQLVVPTDSGGGTSIEDPPPIPQQPDELPPNSVGAVATYNVTVFPFTGPSDGIGTGVFVYDSSGNELNGLRKSFTGQSSRSFTFSLTPGTYRFLAVSTFSIATGTELGGIPTLMHGYVDLSASMNESVSGSAYVVSFCYPGTSPGETCFDSPDSDGDSVGTLVDTLYVPADGTSVASSIVLQRDTTYVLEAEGTIVYWPGGGNARMDAEWIEREDGEWYEQHSGTNVDLLVNGSDENWWGTLDGITFAPHVFSGDSHLYRIYLFEGHGQRLAVSIFDGNTSDNSGSLTIRVYRE